jgi:hypothetical protein
MADNSTKNIISSLSSTTPPVRTRNVVNVIYIAGIAFMVGIFLLLLWVNLCSRHCWCWHDTSVINRFNRPWLKRRSTTRTHDSSSSKSRHQQTSSNDDELE